MEMMQELRDRVIVLEEQLKELIRLVKANDTNMLREELHKMELSIRDLSHELAQSRMELRLVERDNELCRLERETLRKTDVEYRQDKATVIGWREGLLAIATLLALFNTVKDFFL